MNSGDQDGIGWARVEGADCLATHEPLEILFDVLSRLPAREEKTVLHLGPSPLSRLRLVLAGFGRAVMLVDPPDGPRSAALAEDGGIDPLPPIPTDLARLHGQADVVLADGTLAREDLARLDAILEQALGCLREGGLLAATFPAAPRSASARAVRLRHAEAAPCRAGALHEVELQYRLRRAGFRGVRILRVPTRDGETSESLVCLALRRANN